MPAASERRRSPLINRGTFARVSAIQLLVRRFLATGPTQWTGEAALGADKHDHISRQVLSLGSGFDPTALIQFAWRLQLENSNCDEIYAAFVEHQQEEYV